MKRSTLHSLALITAIATVALSGAPRAAADDTELFVGPTVTPAAARPNILFILDTSGSMKTSQAPDYEASIDYGNCASGRIYWSTGVEPPQCNSDQWIAADKFACNEERKVIDGNGVSGPVAAARWSRNRGVYQWRRPTDGDNQSWIECQSDELKNPVHGKAESSSDWWASNSVNDANAGWSTDEDNRITWNTNTGGNARSLYFFSANYVDYYQKRRDGLLPGTKSRINIMKDVMVSVLDKLQDVNVGLMRYSNNGGGGADQDARGGMVRVAMGPIETNKAAMTTTIRNWDPEGWTPLSETLYEATQYLRGSDVVFGLISKEETYQAQGAVPSVLASRQVGNTGVYRSPMTEACQSTYIVYLTDGEPTQDNEANKLIEALPGFADVNGSATCSTAGSKPDYNYSGRCTDELTKWLKESDLRPDKQGVQNVTSYWIGFGDDARGSDFLKLVAERGGGKLYEAGNTGELAAAFTDILGRIEKKSTYFSSPTVAVNAFNRTQNLNYLYMSVFTPTQTYRWLGNVKKYRITPAGVIVDKNGNSAVDPNKGFFYDSAHSYWSPAVDGADAGAGGAASNIPSPPPGLAARTIYSNLTTDSGTLNEHLFALKDSGNLALANNLLLGVASASVVSGRPSIADLVDWAYGKDIFDRDDDDDTTDKRADMGDPLHSRPATVVYRGPADDPDIVLYATTNDGYLHAIDARDGVELWSFVPRQLISRVENLYLDEDVTSREYGLDGAVRVVRLDRNGNGTIEPAGTDINGNGTREEIEKDKVYLFFGMRRGGSYYFGLDVTEHDKPKLLWTIGPAQLPGVGQTWSSPTPAQVNVSRTWTDANPDKLVLIFGGGYDLSQDTVGYSVDDVGKQIFMIDAVTGSLIWRAGPTTDSGAQLQLAKMTNAIPGDIRVADLTGDGFADRMYAADLGGRVWRFDIKNGQAAAGLVTGGVFASLGVGDLDTRPEPISHNRRFFYAPDVALIKSGTSNWINVAIGSGHREKPISDKTVVNRFYSLRDYNVFTAVANNQYKAICSDSETSPCHQIITDDDSRLVDVTTNLTPTIPAGGAGWKMNLQDVGEKVLAESRTFQNQIYFTTYSPQQRAYDSDYCVATVGLNRLHIVDVATGKPVVNFDKSTDGSLERSKELAQGSIAPEAIFIFPTPDADPDDPTKPMPAVPPICLVGLESCGTGLLNPPVRTYWQQRGTN
jgi:type IV pilus assembly protein PilY1